MANGHNPTPGKGVLFTNDYKKSPTHPDWRGELTLVDGRVVKISGWTKETPRGTLISLAEDTYKKEDAQTYPKEVNKVDDSDLPF